MNFIKLLTLALILSFSQSAVAQKYFEGEMSIELKTKDDGKLETSTMSILLSPARIKIQGKGKHIDVKALGADDINGVLIRLDNEDFVMFSDEMEKTALRISKLDIENMMNMVKNMSKQFGGNQNAAAEVDDSKFEIKKTKETKTIAGYKATKSIVTSSDEPKSETHVWLTDELNINLGMLADDWEFLGSISSGSDKWLKKGQFPLLVQTYDSGKLSGSLEVKTIKKMKIKAEDLEVPAGIQLMSFQDMLMKKMMEN